MAGRPFGAQTKDKPFRAALDMELKAAGKDHKALRRIAKKLIACAESGENWAIKEVADRLDGKPLQSASIDYSHTHTVHEITDDELIDIATRGRTNGTGQANGAGKPDIVH